MTAHTNAARPGWRGVFSRDPVRIARDKTLSAQSASSLIATKTMHVRTSRVVGSARRSGSAPICGHTRGE